MSHFKEHQGVIVQSTFEGEQMPGFKIRDSDVWICGFPRSGTTLTQEITYLVNTLDFERANSVPQPVRISFADCCQPTIPYLGGLSTIEAAESPRMVKSHLHYSLLPDEIQAGKGKLIYVARHPGPTVISQYGLMKYLRLDEDTSLEDFVQQFLEDKVLGSPWWQHVIQYWEHRHDNNILFLRFEDIVKEKETVINKIAKFLGKNLTATDVKNIMDYTHIDNMKNNKQVNFSFIQDFRKTDDSQQFINSGAVHGWKSALPKELCQRIEDMLEERLGHTDLRFN